MPVSIVEATHSLCVASTIEIKHLDFTTEYSITPYGVT